MKTAPVSQIRPQGPVAHWVKPFAQVRFLRLKIQLIMRGPAPLRGFAGFSLRGALGEACALADNRSTDEPALPGGLYQRAFLAADRSKGSNLTPPPPFTIIAPPRPVAGLRGGDTLGFGLLLFGEAALAASEVLVALQNLGLRRGLTQRRVPFDVYNAFVQTQAGDICLWGRCRDQIHPRVDPSWLVSGDEVVASKLPHDRLATRRFRLGFRVPFCLRAKDGGLPAEVRLSDLTASIAKSVQAYGRYYGGGGGNLELDRIRRGAERVELERGDLRRITLTRRTYRGSRAGKLVPVPCYEGSLTYRGRASSILPLIAMGEALGVGRNRSMGLGRFEVSLMP